VGLTQSRIKRLLTYSTISHLGFILLALSIYSVESIQAFLFYLIQYTLSNLNTFTILISIGYSLYFHTTNNKEYSDLLDKNNSPIQLINQIKGYFDINPFLGLSLIITLYSFIGVPPLIGFFGKQMVLTAAINNGYIFMCLIAILTSVISAVYYLVIIKKMIFDSNEYIITIKKNTSSTSDISNKFFIDLTNYFIPSNILSNSLTIIISVLTCLISLFIFIPNIVNTTNILTLINFNL
jgi:NADH-ubiquinone oxidoreductase chain 2